MLAESLYRHDEVALAVAAIFKERGHDGILREGRTGKEHAVSLIGEEDVSITVRNMSGEEAGVRRIVKWSMSAAATGSPRHGDVIVDGGEEFKLNGVCAKETGGRPFMHSLTSDWIKYREGMEPPSFKKEAE